MGEVPVLGMQSAYMGSVASSVQRTESVSASRFAYRRWVLACLGGTLIALAQAQVPPHAAVPNQDAQYEAARPKTILELQQWRRSASARVYNVAGREATATLIELNPRINSWLLLTLAWSGAAGPTSFHLENPRPSTQRIELGAGNVGGVRVHAEGREVICDLWSTVPSALDQAQRSGLPMAPLCEGRLYLRNAVVGRGTRLEQMTAFLRSRVWGGERIVQFIRERFYQDAYLQKGRATHEPAPAADESPLTPGVAATRPERTGGTIVAAELGIQLAAGSNHMAAGKWYATLALPGVYVSLLRPQDIAQGILDSHRNSVSVLDAVESTALAYLVAFDLSRFDLGFAVGTDHPGVGWASRVLAEARTVGLPGPDGIDRIAPLIANGIVPPFAMAATVATFTGGFKREHSAFQYGTLARQNHGSHYGFIEHGVVMSKLWPGLATLYVFDDGAVEMKTWTAEDDRVRERVRHARQNGVALIEHDAASGTSAPGPLVARWGPGNWSGSPEAKLRTLRAGVCLQHTATRRFLIYGYFSTATPSAMARVFQAYGCRYAMHLDMNALEHTYLALYVRKGNEISVQHLIEGMSQLDRAATASVVPRFLGFPDNRDLFYLVQRGTSK